MTRKKGLLDNIFVRVVLYIFCVIIIFGGILKLINSKELPGMAELFLIGVPSAYLVSDILLRQKSKAVEPSIEKIEEIGQEG